MEKYGVNGLDKFTTNKSVKTSHRVDGRKGGGGELRFILTERFIPNFQGFKF